MKINNIEIKIIKEDITRLDSDALVCPVGDVLTTQEGLAKFIREEGGVSIEEEARQKAPLKMGEAAWMEAGGLKARYVICAAAEGILLPGHEALLREVMRNILRRARELKISALALPALGCAGKEPAYVGAAKVMIQEIMRYARSSDAALKEIIFCLYDQKIFEVFDKTIRGYVRHIQEDLGPGPYVTVDIIIECSAKLLKQFGGTSLGSDDSDGQGGIVLIERSNPPYGWALPGGFIDYGESLEEAAVREAKEETNLDLVDLRQFHTYSAPQRDPRFHTISTVFIAEGHGEPKAGDDAKNLRIVRYEDLLEWTYAFDHKEIIEEYLVEKDFE